RADRHRAAGRSLRLRDRDAIDEAEVHHPRGGRRADHLERGPRVLRAARGSEGAGRDRSRESPLRRTGRRSGRGARGSAGGFLMQDAVIVSATRTAVGRAPNGALKTVRPDEMAAAVIAEALRRAPGVAPADVEDVIIG